MSILTRIVNRVRRLFTRRTALALLPASTSRYALPYGIDGHISGPPMSPEAEAAAMATRDAAGHGLAPWPNTDRYPLVQGQNLSLQYLASVSRLALTGYRQQYVDLLDELLEYDPHAFAVVSQRILAVAGGRLEVLPAECDDDAAAEEVADMVRQRFAAIPDLKASLAALLWATYYAITGQEIHWRRDGGEWWIDRLSLVHSRRLNYPDSGAWTLYILDQGMVGWGDFGTSPTTANGIGLRVDDYPGKFIIHTAKLRGDYPTREGLGRELAGWMLLKRIAARGASSYLERFGRPWALASYATGIDGKGPRIASDEDIKAAKAAMAAAGAGTLSHATLPDSTTVSLLVPEGDAKVTYSEWLNLVNAEISKATLGQTLTTEVGHSGGNRALGEVQERGAVKLARYDADCLAETLRRDLVTPLVRLNMPGAEHLVPRVVIHVEDEPAPADVMKVAAMAATIGMPLDAEDLARRTGLKLVDDNDADARRLALVKPVELSAIDETIEPPAPPPAPPGSEPNDPAADGADPDEDEADAPPAH